MRWSGFGPLLQRSQDALDTLTRAFHWLSCAVLVGLVLLINCDVAGRLFFDAPVAGVSEIMGQAVVIFVFLQGPQAFRQRRFLRNDSFSSSLSRRRPRIGHGLTLALHGLAFAILLPLLIQSVPLLVKDWTSGDYVGAVGSFTFPTWPARLAVVVGGAVLMLQILFCALRSGTADFHQDGIRL